MKAFNRYSVLAALCLISVALMTASCIKNTPATADDLKFSAESSIATKAVYGADVDDGKYQRIIWQQNDVVTIASDQAQTLWGRSFCDYLVTPEEGDATATSRQSKGKISRKPVIVDNVEDSGLRWSENASGSANFWSVYPATTDNNIKNGIVKLTIPSSTRNLTSQTKDASGSVVRILDPEAGSYPMVAHATASANSNLVKLSYYPAFTAFQITLFNNTEEEITLSKVSLSSTSSDLCGTFTASIDDLAKDEPDSPVISNLEGPGKTVIAEVPQDLANGQGVTFNIFCLPQDLTNLTFSCTFVGSTGEQTRKLALEQNDEPLTFEACKQHRMSLILTKSGGLAYEISLVMKIILANAFPDLFDMNWQTGPLELFYKGTLTPVSEEDIRAAILQVTNVDLKNDFGQDIPYTAEDMAVFVNLVRFEIDNLSTLSSVSIDGLPNFKEFFMDYADSFHEVSITNCPMAETVVINSQSLQTVYLENLTSLKTITVNEGQANSNLTSFTLKNCPDLVTANFGQIGKLETLDLSGCRKLETLNIDLAYVLDDLNLSGCSSLKTLYINQANSLTTLDTDDCSSIESIILTNPQNLLKFESHSTTLKVLKFIGAQYSSIGSQSLVTLILDTPALTTAEFVNNSNLVTLSLSNLSSGFTSIDTFLPSAYGNISRHLSNLSITACYGFTNLTLQQADSIEQMHFISCANLSSVTLKGRYNLQNWPITATKQNCPNLADYYTIINEGNPTIQLPFTAQ